MVRYLILLGLFLVTSWNAWAQPTGAPPNNESADAALINSLPDRYQSTMFYPEEMDGIRRTIENLNSPPELPEPDPQPEEVDQVLPPHFNDPPPVVGTYIYPQFYLTSIVYHGPQQWAIWVNHHKITATKQNVIPNLTVVNITRDYVKFSYRFAEDTQVQPESESADKRITIDQRNREVRVTLEPNQTFSLYSWRIFEGYMPLVKKRVEQAPAGRSALGSFVEDVERGLSGPPEDPGNAPIGPQEPPPEDHAEPPNANQGNDIGSLINRYKDLGRGL